MQGPVLQGSLGQGENTAGGSTTVPGSRAESCWCWCWLAGLQQPAAVPRSLLTLWLYPLLSVAEGGIWCTVLHGASWGCVAATECPAG